MPAGNAGTALGGPVESIGVRLTGSGTSSSGVGLALASPEVSLVARTTTSTKLTMARAAAYHSSSPPPPPCSSGGLPRISIRISRRTSALSARASLGRHLNLSQTQDQPCFG